MKTETIENNPLTATQPWTGSGISTDPYQIGTVDDLKSLSTQVNTGFDTKNVFFVLVNNIDMTGVTDFVPIGGWNEKEKEIKCDTQFFFSGNFDGNMKEVRNLSILKDSDTVGNVRIGLFGYVKGDAGNQPSIKNIGVTNVDMSGNNYVGALIGDFSYAKIDNVYATGKINAFQVSGGLFGNGDNSIVSNSYTNCYVNGGDYLGGFCGENSNNTTIQNCYAAGDCYGNNNVGGFCGINGGVITSSYVNNGGIGGGDNVGGFCGYNSKGKINKCYVVNVFRVFGDNCVGGFCGYNYDSSIKNSYCIVENVNSTDYSGGFCGQNDYPSSTIQNCYTSSSLSNMTTTGKTNGSFLGLNSTGASIKNCYYDNANKSQNKNGTAKSKADMMKADFVKLLNDDQSPLPWKQDFANAAAINNGFPLLDFQTPSVTVTTNSKRDGDASIVTLVGSYIEQYTTIVSKGFQSKLSTSADWVSQQVDGSDFTSTINIQADNYDYRAYVVNQNGDVFCGNILTFGYTVDVKTSYKGGQIGSNQKVIIGSYNAQESMVVNKGFDCKPSYANDWSYKPITGTNFSFSEVVPGKYCDYWARVENQSGTVFYGNTIRINSSVSPT